MELFGCGGKPSINQKFARLSNLHHHISLIIALAIQLFRGESDLGYGKSGRIAGSMNLSALALVDQKTGTYLPIVQPHAAVTSFLGLN